MMTKRSFIRECLLTERRLFQLVVILATVSLLSVLITSALVFYNSQLSIWGLGYLGLFISAGIGVAFFLAVMLACITHWTRGEPVNQ